MSGENNNKKPNFYELYQTVGNIQGTVEAMDKKLDTAVEDHEKRINGLEHSVDGAIGKATGAGFAAGFIGSLLTVAIAVFTFWKKFWQ